MTSNILREIVHGRLPWTELRSVPQQSPEDRRAADEAMAVLEKLLDEHLDALALDGGGRLSDGLVRGLTEAGFLAMSLPCADGGLGLSEYGAFRVYETAAHRSPAVGMLLSAHNSMGPGTYLRALPEGPLHDLLARHLAAGSLSAIASTEPEGAANSDRSATARLTADGSGYLLNGEKVFISNGSLARLVAVTATVEDSGGQVGLFFVEVPSSGFEVVAEHEYMGLRGAPSAHLRMTDVFVPVGHTVSAHAQWRSASPFAELHTLARIYLISAPSMAIARRCLDWSRSFVAGRRVDGRPLAEYEAIQRMTAASAADVYAMDSAVRRALIGTDATRSQWERDALKNITSLTAWRVADRAVSLMAAQGFETARSKAARGVAAFPAEQAQRDLRGLRVGGGVDFNLDRVLAARMLATYYRDAPGPGPSGEQPVSGTVDTGALSEVNEGHLTALFQDVRRLGEVCAELTGSTPAPELLLRQETLIAVNRIVTEVFTMAVVLARAAWSEDEEPHAQDLTAVYCHGSRRRLTSLWEQVSQPLPDVYRRLSQAWMSGETVGLLHP
ncbi:acyl-CoA dehydrogenase family protein [Streptomyces humi]|uniref:acyl-CoA dehydrogenase family protein n=1 Tax=Streptomyces humi TaxID=1428620 RepID=UPI00069C1F76|nr:acyl-CoA dehydrogenase family protein [Streptomyces humi]